MDRTLRRNDTPATLPWLRQGNVTIDMDQPVGAGVNSINSSYSPANHDIYRLGTPPSDEDDDAAEALLQDELEEGMRRPSGNTWSYEDRLLSPADDLGGAGTGNGDDMEGPSVSSPSLLENTYLLEERQRRNSTGASPQCHIAQFILEKHLLTEDGENKKIRESAK